MKSFKSESKKKSNLDLKCFNDINENETLIWHNLISKAKMFRMLWKIILSILFFKYQL